MVCLTESTVYIRTKCTVETVKKLNLWGCDIDDISICERMTSIEVLSLSLQQIVTDSFLDENDYESKDHNIQQGAVFCLNAILCTSLIAE
ncbi:hypothetical protein KIN20_028664 [Parelaphostrongylus tenuis]|uniref:Uncharacterized protein n=1 Tax=Parelaphostrongylus tenuis TaxID=148309 RepID=A0AAD5WEZ5_PARTN|nr:hypothetical protein KIN20_028664 [Parelaphostrongylus tenuis]